MLFSKYFLFLLYIFVTILFLWNMQCFFHDKQDLHNCAQCSNICKCNDNIDNIMLSRDYHDIIIEEEQISKSVETNAVPKVVFIDFGANCGNSFFHFIDKYPDITESHLVEPQPDVFNTWLIPLKKKYEKKVFIYHGAMSDRKGNTTFFVDKLYPRDTCDWGAGYPHGASSLYEDRSGPAESVTVPLFDAYEFVTNLKLREEDLNILKLDIESGEFIVLRRLLRNNLLCKLIDILYVEWHEPPNLYRSAISMDGFARSFEFLMEGCVSRYERWTL